MNYPTISTQSQIRSLAKAVSAAFAASNLTEDEKMPQRIEITDLPWQAPPLITTATLGGIPLDEYLDVPLNLQVKPLYDFWLSTLNMLWNTPGRLMRRGVYITTGRTISRLKLGQRALRFPKPAGWPGSLGPEAGAMFSLEVARAAEVSLPIDKLVSDDDNYYVEIEGITLGVKNGLPATSTPWDHSVAGMVPDMLTLPRGEAEYRCWFDQIAALRSVLHVHRKSFPTNFEGLDQALQALRLLTFDSYCPQLVGEMYVAPMDTMVLKDEERALREAIELMAADMSDRSKLHTLHQLLVPGALSAAAFRQNIFAGLQFPFTMAAGKAEKIEEWLRQQYEGRIPVDLRQLKG